MRVNCSYCDCNCNKTTDIGVTNDTLQQLIIDFEDEIEILREQLYSITQQLHEEIQIAQSYREEIDLVHQDLVAANQELTNYHASLPRININEAKLIAQTIAKSKKTKSAALAALLRHIYQHHVKEIDL
ncbi:hypothetical protein [Aliterella atlantica]